MKEALASMLIPALLFVLFTHPTTVSATLQTLFGLITAFINFAFIIIQGLLQVVF